MKSWYKKAIVGTLGAISLMGLLAGCGKKEEAKGDDGKLKISFFDKNSGSKKFDDRIAKEIEKRTGIEIELQNPTGDSETKLALMLSSRDYADIVMLDRGSDLLGKYIKSKALIPLNDLIESDGPDVKEMYGDTLNKTRSEDGKNYYLSNWYGELNQPVNAWIMRYDYMVEIVGKERADSDEPFTEDEMLDVLKKFKEIHPEVDGKEGIPFMAGEDPTAISGMFGLKTYYKDGDEIKDETKDPHYLQMLQFLNKLHREGLLDPEWVSNKGEVVGQKLATGNVFGMVTNYWVGNTPNAAARAAGHDDQIYLAYKVVGDGIDPGKTTYGGRSSLGWDAIGITDKCKDTKTAMKLINFLASREGQNLMLWGIEGEDYTVEANGDFTPAKSVLDQFRASIKDAKNNTGIGRWTWFIKNEGPTPNTIYMVSEYLDREMPEATQAYKNLPDTYWDYAEFDELAPEGGTPEGLQYQKILDVKKQALPKIINADTEEESQKAFEQLLSDLDAAGLPAVEKVISANYKARQKLWNE